MADLIFVNKTGTKHLFHFLADGNRPALEIHVDAVPGQEKLPICINAIGAPTSKMQETAGFTHIGAKPITDTNGDVIGVDPQICLKCIATYIVPRIHTMMTRAYVPKA